MTCAVVSDAAAVRWDCVRRDELFLRHWPDGSVLYDEALGQLQCLTSGAGEVMSLLLKQREWTTSQLAHALIGEVPNEDDLEMVENVISHFLSLNFINRLPH